MKLLLYLAVLACLLLSGCADPVAEAPPTDTTATTITQEAVSAQPAPTATTVAASPTTPTSPTAPPPSPTAASSAFRKTACGFRLPARADLSCGELTVPEDRRDPTGRTIQLKVAIFKSRNPNPPADPIIYLDGGPGSHTLETLAEVYDQLVDPFLDSRDYIIFDQRGTGHSKPALNCPEIVREDLEMLKRGYRTTEDASRATAATLACHDRLVSEGINLAAYTSAENAADLNDLRLALGYDSWNLYGISYGTRLALTTMRDFPQGLRSVILDSTYPLQASEADVPASARRAFDKLFDSCAVDTACNAAYPDLRNTFFQTVDRLNGEPVSMTIAVPGGSYDVVLTGDLLNALLFQALYSTELIPLLPSIIYGAYEGTNYELWGRLAVIVTTYGERLSMGMYYSVQCGEEVRFSTREELVAADAAFPEQHDVFDQEASWTICSQWQARPADPIENQPVASDIPTLVLAGDFDPITPPSFGQAAAATLSTSSFFTFPGMGHGVSISHPCPLNISLAFLDAPQAKPDAECIAEMQGPTYLITRE